MWIPQLSGLLWSLEQCPKGQSTYPNCWTNSSSTFHDMKRASKPWPWAILHFSSFPNSHVQTGHHNLYILFPKTFSNRPLPPSIVLCHCRGLSRYTSLESLQKSPTQAPQLQDGLHEIVTVLKPKSIYFIRLFKKWSKSTTAKRIKPFLAPTVFPSSSLMLPASLCLVSSSHCSHSLTFLRALQTLCGAVLSLWNSLSVQPGPWEHLFAM